MSRNPFHGCHVILTNKAHNAQFGATPDNKTYTNNNKKEWESFRIVDAGGGKVLLTTHHNTQVGCTPDNKVYTNANKQDWEKWTMEFDQKEGGWHFRSHHGTMLGAQPGNAGTYVNNNRGGWETWRVNLYGLPEFGAKVILTNHHNRQLGCQPSGELYCNDNKQGWEQWHIRHAANGRLLITSAGHANKHLGAQPSDQVYTNANEQDWEQWEVLHHGNGRVSFRSHHGKYLGATPDNKVYTNANTKEWEQWRIVGV